MPGHPPNQDDYPGNKRRRIDAVAAAHLYPTASGTYGQPHLNYSTPQHHVPSYSDGSHYVARQPQTAPGPSSYSATPITQNQQQPAQWAQSYNPTPQSYVANYQDPRSIQQPYYYGQTDPSVYNSPWPPTQQDAQTHVHTPSMVVTTQPHPMPYVQPSHSPVDSQHPYESGPSPSYPSTLQAFDVGNYGLSHDVQSQQQRQVRKSPSNLYFEDASMHLKMQSLPILDSLVSSTHPFRLLYVLEMHKNCVVRIETFIALNLSFLKRFWESLCGLIACWPRPTTWLNAQTLFAMVPELLQAFAQRQGEN
jgi:hypothetical protein